MTSTLMNPGEPKDNLAIGTIIEVDGNHIVAELHADIAELSRVYGGVIYPIGQFGSIVKVHFGRRTIYGYVCRLRMKADFEKERGTALEVPSDARVVEADLFGEGEWFKGNDPDGGEWTMRFERGVSTYPLPQQEVFLTPRGELKHIYGEGGSSALQIGEHVGSGGTPAFADLNELLGKHTAILGSTGSGKSGTVAAVLHSVLERGTTQKYKNWNPRIVILDPHNEYGNAFKDHRRLCTDGDGGLTLPYWLLDLDEFISLVIGKTEFAATSQTNVLKNALLEARREGAKTIGLSPDDITVDSPVPFELGDPSGLDHLGERNGVRETRGFVGAINEQRPTGKDKKQHSEFEKIIRKLDSLKKDSRMKFMMDDWNGKTDDFDAIVQQFLGDGECVRIVDLSGVPNEVAGAASSAIARVLFSVKLWQNTEERESNPVLLVCEEAHRYVPNRGEAQYAEAQAAIQRLAKEGRKYGIGLFLVSQRPSELDATALSQCNSWVVLRITHRRSL